MIRQHQHYQIHKSSGLTLLEAIVAMTLLTVGILGALTAITASVHNVGISSEYSRGAMLAQIVASQLERSTTLSAGSQSGSFDDLDASVTNGAALTGTQATAETSQTTGYTWTALITSADTNGLYSVTITVQWPPTGQQYVMYTLLRPQPLQSTPPVATSGTTTGGGAGGGGGTTGGGAGGGGGTTGGGTGGGGGTTGGGGAGTSGAGGTTGGSGGTTTTRPGGAL